jgi:hypothetical protein
MKARTALLFALGLTAGGLALVLYFAALLAWQLSLLFQAGGSWVPLPATLLFTDHSLLEAGKAAAVLPYIPEVPWTAHGWVTVVLERLHVGLLLGLLGAALMARGLLSSMRLAAAVRADRQRHEDRLRRVADYRRSEAGTSIDGRREPFISSRPAE